MTQIRVETRDNQTIICLVGEVAYHDANAISQCFRTLIDEQKREFIVDFQECPFIDSSGLGALIESYKEVQQLNGSISLQNIPDDIDRVLEITRVKKYFKII